MAIVVDVKRKKGIVHQVKYKVEGKSNTKSFESKREANKFAKEIEAQKTLGLAKDESKITFSEYAPLVFMSHDRKASFKTKEARKYYLSKTINMIGKWVITDVTAIKIKKLFIKLSEDNSDQVLLKYKQIINIVLDSAAEEGLIEYNPMLKVKFKISQENINKVKPIKIDDFKVYMEFAKNNKKYYLGLWAMLYTGMRIGELLAIKKDDFDFNTNTFSVDKNQQRNMEIGPVKKDRDRTGIIHESLAELFYEINLWQKENKERFGESYNDNDLLICNEDGTPIKYSAFREYMRRLDTKTNIKLRPHQLRHTFATMLRGVELKDIQKIGGWKDVDTLINVYQDHGEFQVETIEKINKAFK